MKSNTCRTSYSTLRRSQGLVFLIVAMLVALHMGTLGAEAQGLSAATVSKIKDAVVLIDVTLTTADGETGATGSGFVISPRGDIIANAHVVSMVSEGMMGETIVADERTVSVVFHPGTAQEASFPARVLRENHELDLALLTIDRDTPVYLELADSDAVPETSAIFACGHPLGLREISIRTGTVTAHRTWEGQRYVEHDASAEEGNSGGPVILPDSACDRRAHTHTREQRDADQVRDPVKRGLGVAGDLARPGPATADPRQGCARTSRAVEPDL